MIRRVTKGDLPEIGSWYTARRLQPIPERDLPLLGVIEPGVAVGFLYRTDAPGVALLEGFATNPESPTRARPEAIEAVATALIGAAIQQGARRVLGLCRSRSLVRVAERLGMRSIGRFEMVEMEVQ